MSTPVDGKAYAYEAQVVKAADYALLGGLKMSGGASITTATTLTPADSGNTFLVTTPPSTGTAYVITLPRLADMVGVKYRFVLAGSNAAGDDLNVTINCADVADIDTDYFFANIVDGTTTMSADSGETITINGTNLNDEAGDYLEIEGITASYVHVRAFTVSPDVVSIA